MLRSPKLAAWATDSDRFMALAAQIELACLLEATARKAGNVHPAASFDDLDYADFVDAAQAVAEPLSQVREIGLGRAILAAMRATRARFRVSSRCRPTPPCGWAR